MMGGSGIASPGSSGDLHFTRIFYWKGKPNFGDLLAPVLLDHFADVRGIWSPPATANVVVVGSILDQLPPGWRGIVAGAGKLREYTELDLSQAKVLALRGPLSARGVNGDPVLGDPALLANELVQVDKEYNLGIVPHWSDTTLETRFKQWKPRIIRPDGDPLEVVAEIGRCKKVVASSLHGIVVADAFGIPRRIEMTPKFATEGGAFKFRDHCAAVRVPFEVGLTQEAPRHVVEPIQQELFDMFRSAGDLLWGRRKR